MTVAVPAREVYGRYDYSAVEGVELPADCDGWTPFKVEDRGAAPPQEGEEVHDNRVSRPISRTHILLNVWLWKP